MTNDGFVSLKVLIVEDNQVEIRKFAVDQTVVTNYVYLCERLQFAFPRLKQRDFRLKWKDADGDEVTISSDEEIVMALTEMKSDVFKIIVHVNDNKSEKVFMPSTPFVPTYAICPIFTEENKTSNFNCSLCQQPISGYRYKCLECPNYHHCNGCESQGSHSEHVMIRLQKTFPTLSSLIPKVLELLKQHLSKGCKQTFLLSYLNEYFSRGDADKEKCNGHKRRYRRHGRHCNESRTSIEESSSFECPDSASLIGSIGQIVTDFLGMFKDIAEQDQSEVEQQKNKSSASANEEKQKESVQKIDTVDEKDTKTPSTNTTSDELPNEKVLKALKLLIEMGFNDESKWLTRLLVHFDGDITKALNHIM